MNAVLLEVISRLVVLPFVAIGVIFIHYSLRRAIWRRRQRIGKKSLGFCPSASAAGAIFLFAQILYRPSMAHLLKARLEEHLEEDDEGDQPSPEEDLSDQLRCIRRGKPVERLTFRI
jgi:hypothetical protein